MYNYRLPNKKKWLLTDEFLTTFKEELDNAFNIKEESKPTYWNTYAWFGGTAGFYKALKVASEKHNVKKAIYEYARRLPWYLGDQFDDELTLLMCKKGIIEKGSLDDIEPDYIEDDLVKWEANGEIRWVEEIKHYNGYYVTKRYLEFI